MQTEEAKTTARDEAGSMAESIKGESKNVAETAQQEARAAFQNVQHDVRERADAEAAKFAGTLHDTSRQLRSMADSTDEPQGFVATLAREGASAAERFANRLDGGGLDAVMADVRSWARRSPGAFLLGAAAAGFITGRVVRNLSSLSALSSNGDQGDQYATDASPTRDYSAYSAEAAPETMTGGSMP